MEHFEDELARRVARHSAREANFVLTLQRDHFLLLAIVERHNAGQHDVKNDT